MANGFLPGSGKTGGKAVCLPACANPPYILMLHQRHTFPHPAPRSPHPDIKFMRIKVIHTMFRLTPYILLAASAATPSRQHRHSRNNSRDSRFKSFKTLSCLFREQFPNLIPIKTHAASATFLPAPRPPLPAPRYKVHEDEVIHAMFSLSL